MSALAHTRPEILSVADYLAGERVSEIRHEYVQGQVYAMAGAKFNHNRITGNVFAALWNALQGQPCEPVASDLLLKTARDRYRYPDVMVVCPDDPSTDEYVREAPILIVEVLSSSTRRTDTTLKRSEYAALPSVQEYVLIEQDFVDVEVCRRQNHWQSEHHYLGDRVYLEAVKLEIPVEAIYARVQNEDMQAWRAAQQTASPDTPPDA